MLVCTSFFLPGDYNRFRRKGEMGDLIPRMLGVWLDNHSFSGSFLIHCTKYFCTHKSIAEIEKTC